MNLWKKVFSLSPTIVISNVKKMFQVMRKLKMNIWNKNSSFCWKFSLNEVWERRWKCSNMLNGFIMKVESEEYVANIHLNVMSGGLDLVLPYNLYIEEIWRRTILATTIKWIILNQCNNILIKILIFVTFEWTQIDSNLLINSFTITMYCIHSMILSIQIKWNGIGMAWHDYLYTQYTNWKWIQAQ